MSWEMVDEGWGRRVADFATFTEPQQSREYVVMHQRLGLGEGDRLLDAACGSGHHTSYVVGLRGWQG